MGPLIRSLQFKRHRRAPSLAPTAARLASGPIALFAVLSLAACTLTIGKPTDEEQLETPPTSAPTEACQRRGTATREEAQAVFDEARVRLEAEGTPFDGRVWNEPAAFEAFARQVDQITGCPGVMTASAIPATKPGERTAALAGTQSDFCGPGHDGWFTPTVDQALNEICQAHDACYAACSGPTTNSCVWVPATKPCDDAFFEAVEALPGGRLGIDAWMPILVPTGLKVLGAVIGNAGCVEPAMVCPASVTGGAGVCAHPVTATEQASCASCAEVFDAGGECRRKRCPGDDSALCWASHCTSGGGRLATCFAGGDEEFWRDEPKAEGGAGAGGGGGGSGGAGGGSGGAGGGSGGAGGAPTTPPVEIEPGSLWDVELLTVKVPKVDWDNSAWDLDASAPDPVVVVTVGGETLTTPEYLDRFEVNLAGQVLKGVPAATLAQGLTATVYDRDVLVDDLVGKCTKAIVPASFAAAEVVAKCLPGPQTAGYVLRFRLVAQVGEAGPR